MLKTVDLFSGIGGYRLACDELGIETVWANDFNTHASKVYKDRFGGDAFIKGELTQLSTLIPPHDLLTASLPTEVFPRKGRTQLHVALLKLIYNLLETRQPRYFAFDCLPNVINRSQAPAFASFLNSLNNIGYLVEWRQMCASDFGLPQHRPRILIAGYLEEISQPLLCDEAELSHTEYSLKNIFRPSSQWRPTSSWKQKFPLWGIARGGVFHGQNPLKEPVDLAQLNLAQILESSPDRSFYSTESTLERIKESDKVNKLINDVETLYNQNGGKRQGYTIRGVNGLAPTLTASRSRHYERFKIENEYRRLTPMEYSRLQGFPDGHSSAVDMCFQYELFGNATPPPMAQWLIERLLQIEHNKYLDPIILERFSSEVFSAYRGA